MVNIEGTTVFPDTFYEVKRRRTTDIRGGSIDIIPASTHDWNRYTYGNVGGSHVLLADGNDNRISCLIRNTGGTALYLGLGTQAPTSQGMWLDEGDAYEINQTNLFKGTVWGVSPGTASVRVVEF